MCVSHLNYLIVMFGFNALKFKSPVSKKSTILKFRKVPNLIAFTIALVAYCQPQILPKKWLTFNQPSSALVYLYDKEPLL